MGHPKCCTTCDQSEGIAPTPSIQQQLAIKRQLFGVCDQKLCHNQRLILDINMSNITGVKSPFCSGRQQSGELHYLVKAPVENVTSMTSYYNSYDQQQPNVPEIPPITSFLPTYGRLQYPTAEEIAIADKVGNARHYQMAPLSTSCYNQQQRSEQRSSVEYNYNQPPFLRQQPPVIVDQMATQIGGPGALYYTEPTHIEVCSALDCSTKSFAPFFNNHEQADTYRNHQITPTDTMALIPASKQGSQTSTRTTCIVEQHSDSSSAQSSVDGLLFDPTYNTIDRANKAATLDGYVTLSCCPSEVLAPRVSTNHNMTVVPPTVQQMSRRPKQNTDISVAGSPSATLSSLKRKTRRRIPTVSQRKAANVRERRRMGGLNVAFDVLRKRVPVFAYEKHISRIDTLRLAISYITFMDSLLVTAPDAASKRYGNNEIIQSQRFIDWHQGKL